MLFISRYLGYFTYVVADSESAYEESFTIASIQDAIVVHDMKIEGVSIDTFPDNKGSIFYVDPYQLPGTVTRLQAKTKVLKHTTVKTHGCMITQVLFDDEAYKCGVKIRLSDFGRLCADRIFFSSREREKRGEGHVVVVLDDKLRFGHDMFGLRDCFDLSHAKSSPLGIIVDIRELTDMKLVRAVYTDLDLDSRVTCVIDSYERKVSFLGVVADRYKELLERTKGTTTF